jgi:protein-tyrosine phosphatase
LAHAHKLEKTIQRFDITLLTNGEKSALVPYDTQTLYKYTPDKNQLLRTILNPQPSPRAFSVIRDSISAPNLPSPKGKPDPSDEALPTDFEVWSSSAQVKHMETVCSQITEYMYLGSRIPSENRAVLDKYKVTNILNCAGGICKNFFLEDYKYKTLWLMDASDQDISALFYNVIDFVEEARSKNGIVYVHCHQGNKIFRFSINKLGVSRSSSMVICYLMWHHNWPFQQAHEYVKKHRPVCSPNTGFIAQLLRYKMITIDVHITGGTSVCNNQESHPGFMKFHNTLLEMTLIF